MSEDRLPRGGLDALVRPRAIAVIGASPGRQTLGNVALENLARFGYAGRVVPVHASREPIAGFPSVGSIEDLPDGIDVVLTSIPAGGVADAVRRLDARGVPAAIVNTAGFTPGQEEELRALVARVRTLVHGPNCMGLINLTDATPIYTGGITPRLKAGRTAIVAQSGSAAISLINSAEIGFSKVVTIGSEFRVTGADYLGWLATDEATDAIGLVLEAIPDPDGFADALDKAQAAGKRVALLKVGRSARGARATMAHTGALVGSDDAFGAFAARHGLPLLGDYEELGAWFALTARDARRPAPGAVALMGISGGETALACDVCEAVGLRLAVFADDTAEAVRRALPGVSGENPLDIGQSVGRAPGGPLDAMRAIMDAPETALGVVVQDVQVDLPESSHRNYTVHLTAVAELARATAKPVVLVQPTSERMSGRLLGVIADTDVPARRGLRAGLVAVKTVRDWHARRPDPRRLRGHRPSPERLALREAVAAAPPGPLSADLTARLLAAYAIPVVRSALARTATEAAALARGIGYPLVAKVASPDIPHRSEIGAVALGLTDEAALAAALARIERNVRRHAPGAVIEGFELQEELVDRVQAMVGYQATPPYGALTIVGTGGVLVELEGDRTVGLSPVTPEEADAMLRATRLGRRLDGYRNLMPVTDRAPLAELASRLSELAADFHDLVPECDLNPVLIASGSGEVRVVDALFVAAGR